ncbi:MAG: ABC transporter ATP-binding protein [Nitrospiraceae bacterium]
MSHAVIRRARKTKPAPGMSPDHGGDACILVSRLTKMFRPLEFHPLSWPPIRRQSPVCVLRDVDLSVGRGEILGLLGTNGAGKTTLLKILATLILPTAGRITIEGVDVIREPHRAIQLVSLVTADERSFYWPLTGRQNLEFFAAFQGLSRDAACGRIEELQEQLGLEALDRQFGIYSTGMRHRLAIARGLLRRPHVLLLDEPTRSLDPVAANGLRRLIRDTLVAQLGCTVVLATHNLQEAEELCDREVFLHKGRLLSSGIVEALCPPPDAHGTALVDMFSRLTTMSHL